MIRADTFDLWDTIIDDDSDEPKRAAQGLRAKPDARRFLLWQALDHEAPIDRAVVDLAYDVADAAFRKTWHDQHVTWTAGERLRIALAGLGRALPDAAFAALVREIEEMEVAVPPDTIDGIADAIATLADRYRLCIVSDTIVSPGHCLRRLLALHGLAERFDGFAFSDEVGHSKPHRAMFASAAEQLGVDFAEMVHIGDRDHNDIKGAQNLGMKAILFTAKRDNDRDATTADAICTRANDLPGLIDALAARHD